jgi:hypothetical protein
VPYIRRLAALLEWLTRMTLKEFWAEIHGIGLTQTRVEAVFRTREGETQRVPDPTSMSGPQRAETIERIRFLVLGVAPATRPEPVGDPSLQ